MAVLRDMSLGHQGQHQECSQQKWQEFHLVSQKLVFNILHFVIEYRVVTPSGTLSKKIIKTGVNKSHDYSTHQKQRIKYNANKPVAKWSWTVLANRIAG